MVFEIVVAVAMEEYDIGLDRKLMWEGAKGMLKHHKDGQSLLLVMGRQIS